MSYSFEDLFASQPIPDLFELPVIQDNLDSLLDLEETGLISNYLTQTSKYDDLCDVQVLNYVM